MNNGDLEKLFLLELLVEYVAFSSKQLESSTNVEFQFLNFPLIDICQNNSPPKLANSEKDVVFKTGKSCLFSLPKNYKGEPINLIFNVTKTEGNKKNIIGNAEIQLGKCFSKLLAASGDFEPVSKTLRGIYTLRDHVGNIVCKAGIFIRLSTFGKMIVSQFKAQNPESEQLMFIDEKIENGHQVFNISNWTPQHDKDETGHVNYNSIRCYQDKHRHNPFTSTIVDKEFIDGKKSRLPVKIQPQQLVDIQQQIKNIQHKIQQIVFIQQQIQNILEQQETQLSNMNLKCSQTVNPKKAVGHDWCKEEYRAAAQVLKQIDGQQLLNIQEKIQQVVEIQQPIEQTIFFQKMLQNVYQAPQQLIQEQLFSEGPNNVHLGHVQNVEQHITDQQIQLASHNQTLIEQIIKTQQRLDEAIGKLQTKCRDPPDLLLSPYPNQTENIKLDNSYEIKPCTPQQTPQSAESLDSAYDKNWWDLRRYQWKYPDQENPTIWHKISADNPSAWTGYQGSNGATVWQK